MATRNRSIEPSHAFGAYDRHMQTSLEEAEKIGSVFFQKAAELARAEGLVCTANMWQLEAERLDARH
jgi:hypothetical protein